jgi:hypothetical protein
MVGSGRKEKGGRRNSWAHSEKMVISHVELTPLSLNMDGMADR